MSRSSNPRKIGIIGGSGFIGRSLISRLKQEGDEVFSFGRTELDRSKELDPAALSGLSQFYYLTHIGPKGGMPATFESLLHDNLLWLDGTLEKLGVGEGHRFIFVSSGGAVYGEDGGRKPLSEMDVTNPISPYGRVKLELERHLLKKSLSSGFELVVLRPSNAFGAGQKPYEGQGFIATAIANLLQDREITVFGKTSVRDYIPVSWLCEQIVRLSRQSFEGSALFNIGSGVGRSNDEVLETLFKLVGKRSSVAYQPKRPTDVEYSVLDSRRLYETVGQVPIGDFESELGHAIRFVSSYLGSR